MLDRLLLAASTVAFIVRDTRRVRLQEMLLCAPDECALGAGATTAAVVHDGICTIQCAPVSCRLIAAIRLDRITMAMIYGGRSLLASRVRLCILIEQIRILRHRQHTTGTPN